MLKRALDGSGRADEGANGYAPALQDVPTAPMRACAASIVVVRSTVQELVWLTLDPSLHVLKSVFAVPIAASVKVFDSRVQRAKLAVA
jgi:hypothetical protein